MTEQEEKQLEKLFHEDWDTALAEFNAMSPKLFGHTCGNLLANRADLKAIRKSRIEAGNGETETEYKGFYKHLERLTEIYFGKLGIEAHKNNSWSFQCRWDNAPSWAKVICEFLVCAVEFAEDNISEHDEDRETWRYIEVSRIEADGAELALKLKSNMEYVPAEGKYM